LNTTISINNFHGSKDRTLEFGIGNSFESMVYGHDFVPNESASFLSLMSQLEAGLGLIHINLVNGSVSLAEEHAYDT